MASKLKTRPAPVPHKVADYTILPLTIPALPAFPTQSKHYIYVRPHVPKLPNPDSERSLFIANIPIDASEEEIRSLFTKQLGGGRVEHVDFESSIHSYQTRNQQLGQGKEEDGAIAQAPKSKKRKRDEVAAEGVIEDEETRLPQTWEEEIRSSGSSAVVVFIDRASAKGAMREIERVVKKPTEILWECRQRLGEKRYQTHHTLAFPPKPILQKSINAYLSAFTRAEAARNRLRARQRAVPDEDGFITVVRGGRTGPARLEEAEAAKEKLEERKKKRGAKEDFYRFQVREKRKERERELRKKFEQDRRKVAEMRERRGKVVPMS